MFASQASHSLTFSYQSQLKIFFFHTERELKIVSLALLDSLLWCMCPSSRPLHKQAIGLGSRYIFFIHFPGQGREQKIAKDGNLILIFFSYTAGTEDCLSSTLGFFSEVCVSPLDHYINKHMSQLSTST